ncbi:MAG: hypothetical protein M3N54_10190 [Acidobacteriota bacterium]|nr:hypothetical protein [Acidobacteriota bacterium]
MDEEVPVTIEQLRDMLDMLRRTVEAGSQSARRIEVLEKATHEMFDVLVSLQDNQQRLLESFETQANAQNKLNTDLTSMMQRLVAEMEHLKGNGLVM